MNNPDTLSQTAIWKTYLEKEPSQERTQWIQEVYSTAISWLKAIPSTFPNYTLHDEVHVVNVLNAMGGILGDQITQLSTCECELLILSAALHDIGMVYNEEDKAHAKKLRRNCKLFLQNHAPEYIGVPFDEWPQEKKQDYYRELHPFRLPEILSSEKWGFNKRPREIVPKETVIAVCQAHGEDKNYLKNDESMNYLGLPYDADPRFCALLLRLADILDFDDSRAPEILFGFAQGIERSEEAFRKHLASGGFVYPSTPSKDALAYSAECKEPWIEYKLRDYLKWVDHELLISDEIKRQCNKDWQRNFPFPHEISRDQIKSIGYDSDDFSLTMDQQQILSLLIGNHLYDSNDVFVRELLQNAIDATLLRHKMDPGFKLESDDAAIYIWEGIDAEGDLILRIDDQGVGMTRGMLKRYFLKVGNSYYNSDELTRDLRKHSCSEAFHSISRFGIGFLSCFLCGESAEVSTLYFDDDKCEKECESGVGSRSGYGLRMEVTGLNGYYALRNQAMNHVLSDPMPLPTNVNANVIDEIESDGYRVEPGTTVVVKLDPDKLGTINLKSSVEKYLCGSRMPVYFNGERIGRTYTEIMDEAHQYLGERVYELSDEQKKQFDDTFSEIKGNYPKIIVTTTALDLEEYRILPGMSGVVMRYEIVFDNDPKWNVFDQVYTVKSTFSSNENGTKVIVLFADNYKAYVSNYYGYWSLLERNYDAEDVSALKTKLAEYQQCPETSEELGDLWLPFADKEDLSVLWMSYIDEELFDHKRILLSLDNVETLYALTKNKETTEMVCVYNSVYSGKFDDSYNHQNSYDSLFYFEDDLRPSMDVGRSQISEITPEIALAVSGITYRLSDSSWKYIMDLPYKDCDLPVWRQIEGTDLGQWIIKCYQSRGEQILQELKLPLSVKYKFSLSRYYMNWSALSDFFAGYLQNHYYMTVCYEEGQELSFNDKDPDEQDPIFDVFPPMLFCYAATEDSRRILCSSNHRFRRCITADHPFGEWLLRHGSVLKQRYPRQFRLLIASLKNDDSKDIVRTINSIRNQLAQLRQPGSIDISTFPEITEADFWKERFSE